MEHEKAEREKAKMKEELIMAKEKNIEINSERKD